MRSVLLPCLILTTLVGGPALAEDIPIFHHEVRGPGKGVWDNYEQTITTPNGEKDIINRIKKLVVRRGPLKDPNNVFEVSVSPDRKSWVVTTSVDPNKVRPLVWLENGALGYHEDRINALRPNPKAESPRFSNLKAGSPRFSNLKAESPRFSTLGARSLRFSTLRAWVAASPRLARLRGLWSKLAGPFRR